MTRTAYDAALSNRQYDKDGRLHILRTRISKAVVNPYYGREIPDSDKLGLDPDRVYYLLRDPVELEKAAPSFARVPLMFRHVAVSADDPQQDAIAGTVGSDLEFKAPYLIADLAVWDAEAIAGIETDTVRELSSSYHYTADMTPGVYEGTAYDGVMRDISGNHVALVEAGRAGSDVMAADAKEKQMAESKEERDRKERDEREAEDKKRARDAEKPDDKQEDDEQHAKDCAICGAKDGDLHDRKAHDEAAKDWKFADSKADDAEDEDDHQEDDEDDDSEDDDSEDDDSEDDDEDEPEAKDEDQDEEHTAEDAMRMARDDFDGLVKKLEAKGYSKEYATKVAGKVAAEKGMAGGHAKDRKARDSDQPGENGGKERDAEDKRVKHAMDSFKRELREADEARRAVRPVVGEVIAQDSAEDIYAFALDHMKVDRKGVKGAAAMRALFNAAQYAATPARPAFDSSADMQAKFPNAMRNIATL